MQTWKIVECQRGLPAAGLARGFKQKLKQCLRHVQGLESGKHSRGGDGLVEVVGEKS